MAARPLRPVSLGAFGEGLLGLGAVLFAASGAASAAPWVFSEELNAARVALWAMFAVGTMAFAYGLVLDVFGCKDLVVPTLWLAFPFLGITSAVFVGFFATWSLYFLPIVPLAVATLLLSYFTGGTRHP